MIKVSENTPDVVTFFQKGIESSASRIAADQIKKAARLEVEALSEVENTGFRLAKATEQLDAAKVAYFAAIENGSSDVETLKGVYNNALAGYRDADKAAEKAANAHGLAKAALGGLRELAKREVSTDERQDLAEKGKALPDGSFPIANVADLENAVKAYGLAKNPDAAKAHIIEQAKALDAVDKLPASWNVTKAAEISGVTKDAEASINSPSDTYDEEVPSDMKNLCPDCVGDEEDSKTCETCNGAQALTDAALRDLHNFPDNPEHPEIEKSSGFGTAELLTREFEKSASYQNYIFGSIEKGGPGSGAQPGHPFNGNQHTGGGMREIKGRDGVVRREGYKQTVKRYAGSVPGHLSAGAAHMKEGRELASQGHHAEAAAAFTEAKKSFEKAAGAHYGIHTLLKDRDPATASQHYQEADRIRTDMKAGAAYQADLASRRAAAA